MYRLTNIKLHNICQYDDASFVIDPGLTAVCGRNGNGKTNLLRALAYGLTGLVDGNWGSQQTLQKDGTADPGYVVVTITDGNARLDIRRYSVSGTKFPDSVTGTDSDGKTKSLATRRREVDDYLESIFGISCQLLFQICWGRQNQLASLLTAPAAVINSFLSGLFNTKYLETLRDKLKISISTILPMEDASEQLTASSDKLAALPVQEELDRQIAAVHNELQTAQDEYRALQKNTASRLPYDEWRSRLDAVTSNLERLNTKLASLNVPSDFDQDTAAVERLLGDVCTAITEKQDAVRNITASIGELRLLSSARSSELSFMETKHTDIIEHLHTSSPVCELCGGTISELSAYQRKRCEQLTGHETEQEYESAYAAQLADKTNEISSYAASVAELQQKEMAINEELQELSSNKELLEQLVATARRRDAANLLKEQIALQEGVKADLDAQQPLSQEDTARLSTLAKKCEELQTRERELVSASAAAKATREMLVASIAELEEHQTQYEINDKVRRLLLDLRDALSQSRAQTRYLASKIAAINAKLDRFMRGTDLPFSLRLNPQTHLFDYVTTRGHVHPAGHLSGAQLNISAVLLQMAIFEVVQPHINLFLVDEPSEALDDQNKTMMAGLFQRMSNLLPAMDGVMLIVTRDWQLIDSCNNQINISEEIHEGD